MSNEPCNNPCTGKCVSNEQPTRFVVYVDVGNLPSEKTKLYLEELKEQFKRSPSYSSADWFFLPIRDGQTRIERIS